MLKLPRESFSLTSIKDNWLKFFTKIKELISNPILHNIWRAPTDNDMGGSYEKSFHDKWIENGYNYLKRGVESVNYKKVNNDKIQILVDERYFNEKCEVFVQKAYSVLSNGDLKIDLVTDINPIMPVLPKIGLTTKVSSNFRTLNGMEEGPMKIIRDRKIGSLIDRYQHNVDELYFPYIRPQGEWK